MAEYQICNNKTTTIGVAFIKYSTKYKKKCDSSTTPRFFESYKINDGDIVYMRPYIPYSSGEKDLFSTDYILAYKDCSPIICADVASFLLDNIGNNISLIGMPPSETARNGKTSNHTTIRMMICENHIRKNRLEIEDLSNCLYRSKDIQPQHKSAGSRSEDVHNHSLAIKNKERIQGKHILIIDDIYTSGCTFNAARKKLLDAGAASVAGFMIGKTYWGASPSFIVDLDSFFKNDFLDFDIKSKIKKFNNNRLANSDDIIAFLKGNDVLSELFGTRNIDNIVYYLNDSKSKEALSYCRCILHAYEPDITLLSNNENLRRIANKLGMKTRPLEIDHFSNINELLVYIETVKNGLQNGTPPDDDDIPF